MRFLHRFRERGTIFFVSHDTGAVLNLCDKAMWLNEGRMVRFGDAKSVVEGYVQWNMEQLQGAAERQLAASAPSAVLRAESPSMPDVEVAASDSSSQRSTDRKDAEDGGERGSAPGNVLQDEGFGQGGATIEYVGLHRRDGERIRSVKGGEPVTLRVAARARADLLSPIIGFHFKDRLGQVVFGDNSFLSTVGAPLAARKGELVVGTFEFFMPHMRTGEYLFDVAFAEGTQAAHVQHHWVYDALVVHVIADMPVFGMLTLPCAVTMRRDADRAHPMAGATSDVEGISQS
jgi:lipopolysaccharide transport system ATP-binding protein